MKAAVFGMFSASKFGAFEKVSGFARYFDKLITNQLFSGNFQHLSCFAHKIENNTFDDFKGKWTPFSKKNYFESVMRK